ncbi:Putative metal-dependent hydrolase YfiT [Luteitalea pratensis]|uniref:Metal-dependent hydrolase YfiT n=1 Tax=Luteitalea pratensis TaxID=1855912 RepID=A0A143PHS7_LUTPR|nr:putative metal-dependent hydrolase [Luteitalea pratensis]AMY07314.1 Putative metal-dependent hydrolase YfiT [Luteitalea pratensis]
MSEALRYPVGRFQYEGDMGADARRGAISTIVEFPQVFRAVATSLSEAQLGTRYRDGGWAARQVIHHVSDSHINAYVRTRWLLTEDRPTIKAYDEKGWAELPDASSAPIELSLALLAATHQRWTLLLESLPDEAFGRELVHPVNGPMTLDKLVHMYAWHGRHHMGHLQIVSGLRA